VVIVLVGRDRIGLGTGLVRSLANRAFQRLPIPALRIAAPPAEGS
jgi:hypothetical protein